MNRLILDVNNEFNQVDEATVIALNRAFAKFPANHSESTRAFRQMNSSVTNEILEKSHMVDIMFLVKYLASFYRSSKFVTKENIERIAGILSKKLTDPDIEKGHVVPYRFIREYGACIAITEGKSAAIVDEFVKIFESAQNMRFMTRHVLSFFDFIPQFKNFQPEQKERIHELMEDRWAYALEGSKPLDKFLRHAYLIYSEKPQEEID